MNMQSLTTSNEDALGLRKLYACFPSGVVALCALLDGIPTGLAVSSFTSVSLTPPLVSVSLQSGSATWAALEGAPTFGISVLGQEQDELCRQLSRKGADRFQGVEWTAQPSGAVLIAGAAAWLECKLYHRFVAGDHEIAILSIVATRCDFSIAPLVFHGSRFRKLAVEPAQA